MDAKALPHTFKQTLTCTKDIVPSYEVIEEGRTIRFSPCGIISNDPDHVRNYYCAACQRYMNDVKLLRHRLGQYYEQR